LRYFFLAFFGLLLSACNNQGKTDKTSAIDSPGKVQGRETEVRAPLNDSTITVGNGLKDSILEAKIIDTLLTIPFVKKTDRYLDSLTGHKRGISFIIDSVRDNEVSIMAGYNGPERFETYYNFTVYLKTLDINIEYPDTGEMVSVEQFIKLTKE